MPPKNHQLYPDVVGLAFYTFKNHKKNEKYLLKQAEGYFVLVNMELLSVLGPCFGDIKRCSMRLGPITNL